MLTVFLAICPDISNDPTGHAQAASDGRDRQNLSAFLHQEQLGEVPNITNDNCFAVGSDGYLPKSSDASRVIDGYFRDELRGASPQVDVHYVQTTKRDHASHIDPLAVIADGNHEVVLLQMIDGLAGVFQSIAEQQAGLTHAHFEPSVRRRNNGKAPPLPDWPGIGSVQPSRERLRLVVLYGPEPKQRLLVASKSQGLSLANVRRRHWHGLTDSGGNEPVLGRHNRQPNEHPFLVGREVNAVAFRQPYGR